MDIAIENLYSPYNGSNIKFLLSVYGRVVVLEKNDVLGG